MEITEYLFSLGNRFQRFFSVQKQVDLFDHRFDLYAYSEIHNEKYFGSKNVKLWRAENHDFVFVKDYSSISEEDLHHFILSLKKSVDELVVPHSDHMSSTVTGVMVTDGNVSPQMINRIKKFSYQKTYKLGLQGWCDIRLLLVVPSKNQIFANRKGKEVMEFYLPGISPKKTMFKRLKEVFAR